jgi:hypothetical protein
MFVFNSRALSQLKEDLIFLRASLKLTTDNIARSNSPGAEPLKLERSSFQQTIEMMRPNHGNGFAVNNPYPNRFMSVVDKENRTEATPGESRISIENESIRMAELDDEHNLRLKLMSSWKKAVRMVTGNGG